jgi:hypothetical protein
MYSNQKDQISLEEVYRKVHSDEVINEDANETIGGAILYGTILLPAIISHLSQKYPSIKNKLIELNSYLRNKFENDKSLDVMKKNADEHGGQGADDYYKDLNKKIATEIKKDQFFRSNIDDDYEQAITQDIVNLLPKNLTNKSKQQAISELDRNITQDNIQISQTQKRKQMGLPPLRTNIR